MKLISNQFFYEEIQSGIIFSCEFQIFQLNTFCLCLLLANSDMIGAAHKFFP